MLKDLMKISLSLLLFLSLSSQAAIFGNDDRSVLKPSSPFQPWARATAIAVLSTNVSINQSGTIDLDTDVLDQMCKSEPLVSGPSLSYSCTGFLIAPDLLVTAGHCVYAVNNTTQTMENETGKACEAFSWLFDFQEDAAGKLKTKGIHPDQMYKCKRIIYAANREGKPFDDYALIQLARPVKGRAPYQINAGALNPKELRMIGFPFGTSMKLTRGGSVLLNNPARQSFITNLDAFEGNSGSPVFNEKNQVVGILVGGTPSLNTTPDERLQCERLNRCNQQGKNCLAPDADPSKFPGFQTVGSEVQRILPIANLLKKMKAKL